MSASPAAHLGGAGVATSAGEVTYLEAIRAAMRDAMRDDRRVFLMGEDVGHFGGPFKVTDGLLAEFGPEQVVDTPIAEEGFVGAAVGAAWMGERPIAELYHKEEVVERRNRVGSELARLMYEASVVIKSEKWGKTEVESFLLRLGAGVEELKRGLTEDFDPADPLRQWAAWFDENEAAGAAIAAAE